MRLIDPERNNSSESFRRPWMKVAILLAISMGLLLFSEQFSPARLFEPQSTGWVLWVSYAKDLIQPFAFYFFLCLGERWLKTWQARALLAFALPTLLEFGQFLYYRVSTSHYVGAFDPVDIIMYTVGVGFAVMIERFIFAKALKFW
jgi:glycopeptide antibiotics resistance protein